MSYCYDLCCLDCNEEVGAVASSSKVNSVCGDLSELLEFIVEHHGHRLASKGEDESLINGNIKFDL